MTGTDFATERLSVRRTPWKLRQERLVAGSRQLKSNWRLYAQNPMGLVGVAIVALFGILAMLHPLLMATVWEPRVFDPLTGYDFEVLHHPAPPSARHLLGTDSLGHDVLSVLLAATTPTFKVGFTAAITTALLGVTIGVVAAFYKGVTDAILLHIADAFLLLPAPLFMVVVGMRFQELGPVPLGLIYGIIAGAGGAAIVLRSQALTVVAKPFIQAARVAGGGNLHIMFVHVVPHLLPLAALYMMLAVTGAVVADAFIAFFGFSRTYLNWGTMIYNSLVYSYTLGTGISWHVLLPPAMALSIFAAGFYLIARALHRVADPRLRSR